MSELKIDVSEVAMAMESGGDGIDWFLDLKTGDVFPVLEDGVCDDEDLSAERVEKDPERYVGIERVDSREGFRLMEEFVDSMEEGEAKRSLLRALGMRGPFRCFKDTLLDFGEVRDRWFVFYNGEMERLAREFLEGAGVEFLEISGVKGE